MKYDRIPSNIPFFFRKNGLGGMTNTSKSRSSNLVTGLSSSIPYSRTSEVSSPHDG
jgi:hypothetical protein